MKKLTKSKVILAAFTIAAIPLLVHVPAYAHVTVKPVEVVSSAYQTFTTSVPNEKDVPVTAIRLVIPNGVQSVTPTVKQGWEISTKKTGDTVTEISWTGGTIAAGLRDEFTFSAQAPSSEGEIVWKAYQTYQDGSVVAWDQKPVEGTSHHSDDKTKGPYSVTAVSETDADRSDESEPMIAPYVLSGLALVVSFISLAMLVKRR